MNAIDYVVLGTYFLVMAGIGVWAMRRVKKQEDYFLGGRRFGKLFQTFAAFGAGTGSADPVNTASRTFTSGMSGMWGVMYWLFVTPVYWISGVWYRRMRCITLGDWFVERYESKTLGVAYALFGCFYYMVYGAMLFAAIGKVAAPLMGDTFGSTPVEYVLVPIIALIVIIYGSLGGLTAAYWTDFIQGLCIILLSVLLIPFGLVAVVDKFGGEGLMSGFRIMHEQLPEDYFTIVGASNSSEFPLYAILAITLINMIGIVVTPHFIATGGGSAKSEQAARIGLVTGNFLKRFCTIGWVLTALVVLTLYSGDLTLRDDPDKTWGVATMELLGPAGLGLVGLMMACLLAALMSSVDCYMLVCSALVVRNIYVPFVNEDASEKECVNLGRITGVVVVAGAVIMALMMNDVFRILQVTWIVPMTFAAPFWIGMYWRRATTTAAWGTVVGCVLLFFVLPRAIPVLMPGLRQDTTYLSMNEIIETQTTRAAAPSDVTRRAAEIEAWETAQSDDRGPRPEPLAIGGPIPVSTSTGGRAIFWDGGFEFAEQPRIRELSRIVADEQTVVTSTNEASRVGVGNFRPDLALFQAMGVPLESFSNAALSTLDLPLKIVAPFLMMIALSFVTKRNTPDVLDRFYVKMKTPVDPDPERDEQEMQKSRENPGRFADRKLIAHPDIEIQRPTPTDFWGFIVCVLICFGIISLVLVIAGIGA